MTLPNFLIGGAGKSGTTTLWAVLRRHPQVFMPRVKDVSFFSSDVAPRSVYHHGIDWYGGLFAGAEGRIAIGEASVAYLYDPESPRLIQKHLGMPRMVFILRDPCERTYSHYWQERKRGVRLPPFDDLMRTAPPLFERMLRSGRYATHLGRYLQHFPRERVLALRYEHLRDTPDVLYRRVCEFLGVDPQHLPRDTARRSNPAARPRFDLLEHRVLRSPHLLRVARALVPGRLYPWARTALAGLKSMNRVEMAYRPMSAESRARLIDRFRAEIEGTETLLGWDLSAWKRIA
jgi:hypothetical protein